MFFCSVCFKKAHGEEEYKRRVAEHSVSDAAQAAAACAGPADRQRPPEPERSRAGVCFHWQQGRCTYGSNCRFAHGDGQAAATAAKKDQASRQPRERAAAKQAAPQDDVCVHWQQGRCKYGSNCRFSHADKGGGERGLAAGEVQAKFYGDGTWNKATLGAQLGPDRQQVMFVGYEADGWQDTWTKDIRYSVRGPAPQPGRAIGRRERELNQNLCSCNDAHKLCILIETCVEDFNYVNVATGFRKLLGLKSHRASAREEQVLQLLEQAALKNIDDFEPQHVSATLHAIAKSGYRPSNPRLFDALERQYSTVIAAANGQVHIYIYIDRQTDR